MFDPLSFHPTARCAHCFRSKAGLNLISLPVRRAVFPRELAALRGVVCSSSSATCGTSPSKGYRARWSCTTKLGYAQQGKQVLDQWAADLVTVEGVTNCSVLSGAFGTNGLEIELDIVDLHVDMLGSLEPKPHVVAQLDGLVDQPAGSWQLFVSQDSRILKPARIEQAAVAAICGDSERNEITEDTSAKTRSLSNIAIPTPDEIEQVLQEGYESARTQAPGRKRNNLVEPLVIRLPEETEECNQETPSPEIAFAVADKLQEESGTESDEAAECESSRETDDPYAELRKTLKPGQRIVEDWKGDPMIINPGDNLCGLF